MFDVKYLHKCMFDSGRAHDFTGPGWDHFEWNDTERTGAGASSTRTSAGPQRNRVSEIPNPL